MKPSVNRWDTLCSIPFQIPFSSDPKALSTVQVLSKSSLYHPHSLSCHFCSPYSLGMTIKPNGNSQLCWFLGAECLQKTRWGSFCNLVPHSNSGLSLFPWHWAGLQMLLFIPYLLCDFGTQIPCSSSFVPLIHAAFSSIGAKNSISYMCLKNTLLPLDTI